MIKNNKKIIILLFVLLLFTKIDFRFKEITPGLIHDDAAYYYHAQTIGVDLDFDYSNQLSGTDKRNLNVETGDPVPVHPIGVGLLAGPIVFLSNIISSFFKLDTIISFNYFIYSLSPIFYLFLSMNLLVKVINTKIRAYELSTILLLTFGSGISYYAFERFSMSHVYEFFSTSLIIFYCFKYESIKNIKTSKIYELFFPLLLFFLLTIRWSNYHLFLIPILYFIIFNENKKHPYKSIYFLIGLIISAGMFLYHTKYLYGIYTFNPSDIFLMVENRLSSNYDNLRNLNLLIPNIYLIIKTFITTSFSQEFGIFYFSPIVFIGYVFNLYFLFKRKYMLFLIYLFINLIPFVGVVVFQNTSYSYGFRYLMSTIPLNILIFYKYFYDLKLFKNYLYFMSFFGIVGLMMFEVSNMTVLSENYLINRFGQTTKYTNPDYLIGVLRSLFIFDSYLNIIFTSFFGVIIIKTLSMFINPIEFITQFRTVDEDIQTLIDNSVNISWFFLLILIIFFVVISLSIKKSFQL